VTLTLLRSPSVSSLSDASPDEKKMNQYKNPFKPQTHEVRLPDVTLRLVS